MNNCWFDLILNVVTECLHSVEGKFSKDDRKEPNEYNLPNEQKIISNFIVYN